MLPKESSIGCTGVRALISSRFGGLLSAQRTSSDAADKAEPATPTGCRVASSRRGAQVRCQFTNSCAELTCVFSLRDFIVTDDCGHGTPALGNGIASQSHSARTHYAKYAATCCQWSCNVSPSANRRPHRPCCKDCATVSGKLVYTSSTSAGSGSDLASEEHGILTLRADGRDQPGLQHATFGFHEFDALALGEREANQ